MKNMKLFCFKTIIVQVINTALKSLLKTAYGKLEIETDDLDTTGNTVEYWGITFEQGV